MVTHEKARMSYIAGNEKDKYPDRQNISRKETFRVNLTYIEVT